METAFAAVTHPGRLRSVNEDSCLARPPVFLVADGMGGHSSGDVASAAVVSEFAQLSPGGTLAVHDVADALHRAHAVINDIPGGGRAAGTTAVVAVAVSFAGQDYWVIANVGDSRVYRLDEDRFRQVTVDHSVVQEMVDAGEVSVSEARSHPQRHIVTRAVGGHAEVDPEFWVVPARPGERLLLCTDGLTNEVDDSSIAALLREQKEPAAAAQHLVDLALRMGGRDNVTVVVVDVLATQDDLSPTVPRQVMT